LLLLVYEQRFLLLVWFHWPPWRLFAPPLVLRVIPQMHIPLGLLLQLRAPADACSKHTGQLRHRHLNSSIQSAPVSNFHV
jgi:hypothetical protein